MSDLRALVGHEVPVDAAHLRDINARSLFDISITGVLEVDRLLVDSVNECPRMKHEAEARVRLGEYSLQLFIDS